MKKIFLIVLSFLSIASHGNAEEMFCLPPLLKSPSIDFFVARLRAKGRHRSYRGPRGFRGHRGRRGKAGAAGKSATGFAERAYLLAPMLDSLNPPILISPHDLPLVVPVDRTDLNSSFFESITNSFIIPESGVYRITYFLSAVRNEDQDLTKLQENSSGLVLGIIVDADLSKPIGMRSLPLVSSLAPSVDTVWGSHEIVARLNIGQRIQLGIFADPQEMTEVPSIVLMQCTRTGKAIDEVAYLSIQKVGQ